MVSAVREFIGRVSEALSPRTHGEFSQLALSELPYNEANERQSSNTVSSDSGFHRSERGGSSEPAPPPLNHKAFEVKFDMRVRARAVSRFQEGRAAKYGDHLASEAFQMMDNELKLALQYTICELHSQKKKGTLHSLTWSELMSHFSGSKFLQCDNTTSVRKQDHFIAHHEPLRHNLSTFLSQKNAAKAMKGYMYRTRAYTEQNAKTWFRRLVSESDVYDAIKNDQLVRAIDVVSYPIAEDALKAGTSISKAEQCFVDIGVLRIPDITKPYVQLYRVRLAAWTAHVSTGAQMSLSSGIDGEFDCICYVPRQEVIRGLKPRIMEQALRELKELISGDDD